MNMSSTPPIRCPACLDFMTQRILQAGDGQKIIAVECRDCGVMFNRPQISNESIDAPLANRVRPSETDKRERAARAPNRGFASRQSE